MPQKRIECFRLLFDHFAWIEHRFLRGIRESRKARSLWGMIRGVGWVRMSIHQSWLVKGLGLVLLCWGFKLSSRRDSVNNISTRTMHKSTTPSLSQTIWPRWVSTQFLTPYSPDLGPWDFWLLPKLWVCRYETIEEMKEAVTKVIDWLTQEEFHGAFHNLLERYKCIAAGKDYFEGDLSFMCVLSIKVPIRKKSGNLSYNPGIYIYIYIYIYILYMCVCVCVCERACVCMNVYIYVCKIFCDE